MSIFVCGDIHSTLDINKLDQFLNREDLNEKDYLIICGDTGICGFSKEQERATREYLRKLPMTVLFADGNHEQFDALNSYPIEEWHGGNVHIIEPGIIHLMRGQVYQIAEKRFFVF
ncbi:MAG: metallophosphoesterase, partial [Coprococcus sp.]